eukprot:4912609-Amphidinium_carterae.1
MSLSKGAMFRKHPSYGGVILSSFLLLGAFRELTSTFAPFGFHAPLERLNRVVLMGGATMGPQISLDELLQEAADEGSDLDARVDEAFPGLQAMDFAILSAQAESDGAQGAALRLHQCVQKAMDARMMLATRELNELLSSDGDITENTRNTLKKFDNPVPLLA